MNRPITTIKQIADATGVHPSTVSRALDPKKRHLVADDVAKRIVAQAEALGYQPNRLAANLRLGRSDLIGVLLPDIANPVFAPILGGITEVLSTQGYAPIVADAGNAPSQQISFVERLLSQRVDGLILATVSQDDELVGFCIQRGLPVILVNRSEARDRVSSVVSDDDMGMRLAVDHLVGLGHRHIAHVAGPMSTSTGALRRDGFEHAMSHHGLRGLVREAAAYTREAGAQAAEDLLAATGDVTAIVAANDLLALGVLDVFKQRGLRCPEDISLVGHNDMPLMDVVSPPLTTVRIEHREMGRIAARMLAESIKSGSSEIRHVILRPELVVRGSTGNSMFRR
ncbi:LacI family DNA-binding transcriptional regulator [Bradyrhizobium sp. CCBAU 53421]|uniref:LacI family DNA-binding transcriptional regulator n=1 Tax=Bradyrhizobium sp. CCBAU 53421 TaxID=1325120 RepID=UPI00188CA4B8|nr:LacI family DNA-binding transcriptional regulator [Bradyrhizobium sp. CCBAU 53421]QOZ30807.1 LacI family transcriptional regulator [Bradyrhizobium sp. CCBAU 53421]